jgi:hypothetical protein
MNRVGTGIGQGYLAGFAVFCLNQASRDLPRPLFQSLAGKGWQDESCSVDVLVVVFTQLLLLLGRPATQRLFQVGVGILGTDHEADLARGICGNGGVGVFDAREDLSAVFLEFRD